MLMVHQRSFMLHGTHRSYPSRRRTYCLAWTQLQVLVKGLDQRGTLKYLLTTNILPPYPILPTQHTILTPIPWGGGNQILVRVLGLVGG